MLYSCKGGYPIGIFVYFVRSSIAAQGEKDMSQVFLGVSFDFYGKKNWPLFRLVHRVWQSVHNRVTANVLHRFKQLCEWRFERTSERLFRDDRDAARSSEPD